MRRPPLYVLPALLLAACESADLDPAVAERAGTAIAEVSCEGLTAVDLFPACHLSRDSAWRLVRDELHALGLRVREVELGEGPLLTRNLVAEIRGTTKPSEVILVGAHIDAFHAGADDNSSGVAAMLETARVLSTGRFARTIRFAAFDLEEYGLVGSAQYVDSGLADDVVAAMVLDCVGYASSEPGSQQSLPGLPLGDVGDFLGVVGNDDSTAEAQKLQALNHRLGIMPVKTVILGGQGAFPLTGNLMRSDHALLWLQGKPALFLTDTANFRNPHYHRETDTPETLDPKFLAGATRVLAATTAYWAEVQ